MLNACVQYAYGKHIQTSGIDWHSVIILHEIANPVSAPTHAWKLPVELLVPVTSNTARTLLPFLQAAVRTPACGVRDGRPSDVDVEPQMYTMNADVRQ